MARKKMTPGEKAAAKAVRVGHVERARPDVDAATGTADGRTPLDVDSVVAALTEWEQIKDEALDQPAEFEGPIEELWTALAGCRISGQDLAAQLRQGRRETRLAEKGY